MLRTDLLARPITFAKLYAALSRHLNPIGFVYWIEVHVSKFHESDGPQEERRMLLVDGACCETHVAGDAMVQRPIRIHSLAPPFGTGNKIGGVCTVGVNAAI